MATGQRQKNMDVVCVVRHSLLCCFDLSAPSFSSAFAKSASNCGARLAASGGISLTFIASLGVTAGRGGWMAPPQEAKAVVRGGAGCDAVRGGGRRGWAVRAEEEAEPSGGGVQHQGHGGGVLGGGGEQRGCSAVAVRSASASVRGEGGASSWHRL